MQFFQSIEWGCHFSAFFVSLFLLCLPPCPRSGRVAENRASICAQRTVAFFSCYSEHPFLCDTSCQLILRIHLRFQISKASRRCRDSLLLVHVSIPYIIVDQTQHSMNLSLDVIDIVGLVSTVRIVLTDFHVISILVQISSSNLQFP